MKPVPTDSASATRKQPFRMATGPGLLALLLILCRGTPAFAQEAVAPPVTEERHHVEIIVFRHLDQRSTTPEAAQTLEPAADSTLPPTAIGGATSMQESAAAAPKLGAIDTRLRQSPAYRLLYHGAWLQTLDSREQAIPTPLPASARAAGLDGTITLYREHYVHARLDIALHSPAADAPGTEIIHVLRQSRRLRGSSAQYFDHPQFGVILLVE